MEVMVAMLLPHYSVNSLHDLRPHANAPLLFLVCIQVPHHLPHHLPFFSRVLQSLANFYFFSLFLLLQINFLLSLFITLTICLVMQLELSYSVKSVLVLSVYFRFLLFL